MKSVKKLNCLDNLIYITTGIFHALQKTGIPSRGDLVLV